VCVCVCVCVCVQNELVSFFLQLQPVVAATIQSNLALSFGGEKPDPRKTVAILIRGSDKCGESQVQVAEPAETACMPFSSYIAMANAIRAIDSAVDTLVVASEDERYIRAAQRFERSSANELVEEEVTEEGVAQDLGLKAERPRGQATRKQKSTKKRGKKRWRLVLNLADPMQGSCHSDLFEKKHVSNADVMVNGTLTSLHLSMHAKYFVLNCHSMWARIVINFAASCARTQPVFFCTNNQPIDSGFHLCSSLNRAQPNITKCLELTGPAGGHINNWSASLD